MFKCCGSEGKIKKRILWHQEQMIHKTRWEDAPNQSCPTHLQMCLMLFLIMEKGKKERK